ncbi:MAG TPA: FAD-dependent oxidoreductase [Chthoniobacterales bacterium]|nr:FAD-dependent oxidoreductase [Chthoniobacterales bacterium]
MKVIVVGAGINGVTAAIELKKRGHEVTLIDSGPLPHPLAASTDISKAVRASYGPDEDYTELVERAVPLWRKWNEAFGTKLYHETGFLFMRRREMKPGDFEFESFKILERRGHSVERIGPAKLRERFPAWSAELFPDGFFEATAGYAESGRVVSVLVERATSLGVRLRAAQFSELLESAGVVKGIALEDRQQILGDAVVMAVGAWTPFLLPFTQKFFRATGHPVFHLKPRNPESFLADRFPVFGADISMTGYYGFPIGREGVMKIGSHGAGREMSPESSQRAVTAEEEKRMREFLSWAFPVLADAPIVYSRICLYCDTHDGNFWIAPDPERGGLSIATGDSGHGFKFAPVLGELIADAVEGRTNAWSHKFRWRPEVQPGIHKEAARFQTQL